MFYNKYNDYLDDATQEGLEDKLNKNVEESKLGLLKHLGSYDKETVYLINELLEDQQHLDAYLAVKISKGL